jgi:ribonuclease HI
MTYTLHTDASYAATWKVGSYAFVAEMGGFTHKESGILKRDIPDNLVSELLAFSKGLRFINGIVHKEERPLITIEVYTDCEWVLKVINGTLRGGKYHMIVRAVKHAMAGYKIKAHHVKAHQEKMDEHMLLNSWCDHAAKSELRREGWL